MGTDLNRHMTRVRPLLRAVRATRTCRARRTPRFPGIATACRAMQAARLN